MPIKVRVGQSDAVKILASAGGGSISAVTSKNVIGGIASVTSLEVSGISTLSGGLDLSNFVVSGISTFTGLIDANGGLDVTGGATLNSLNVTGIATIGGATINDGAFENLKVTGVSTFTGLVDANGGLDVIGGATLNSLNVSGLSTFTGITTTVSDLYVGRNLFIKGDVTFDEFDARNLNITGISTFVGFVEFKDNVSIAGTLTYEDVTNVDSVGLITARSGVRITTGGLIISSGVATFTDAISAGTIVATGTLTAGLIDGGSF